MPNYLSDLTDKDLVVLGQVSIELVVEGDHSTMCGHAQREAVGAAFQHAKNVFKGNGTGHC